MTRPDPLDSILASPAPVASVITSVSAFAAAPGGGAIAVLHRTDVASGDEVIELLRLDARAQRRAAVTLSDTPDDMETALVDLLTQDTDLHLIIGETMPPVAVSDKARPVAAALAALGLARYDQICRYEGGVMVRGRSPEGEPSLYLLPEGAAPVALSLDGLDLSEHRQIGTSAVIGGALFVSLCDPVAGFDVVRWDLGAPSEPAQTCISRGAQRFAVNAVVAGVLAHDKGLLVGTAALASPRQPAGFWGPELLLVKPDGSWDLVIGQPRFSPGGLLLPASGLTAGMGQVQNAALRAMGSDGVLTVIALQDYAGPPEDDRRAVAPELSHYNGAVRLFASFDLQDWTELPHDLPGDIGAVTRLHVTEETLFVGYEALGADAMPVAVVPLAD